MENKPLVSVIIPTKNSTKCLEDCLKSIRNQTYKNIELIVVDNNSSDNSKDIARRYTDKVFNFGPERSAQRNCGAKNANGEYLLIDDSDIYLNPDSVKECVELAIAENCDAIILPEKSIGVGFWSKVKAFERSFYVGNDYMEGARFFKKNIYEKVGGYDKNLYAGEDWDLTIRFREAGYKISRTHIYIEHDEGKMNLLGSSKKKKYYGSNFFDIYAKKNPKYFKKQMNVFCRYPLRKILEKGLKHPILLVAMIIMKGLEINTARKEIKYV